MFYRRAVFDLFNALDGNCLNGMEGEAGILKLRFYSDGLGLKWDEPQIKFFPGAYAGHAVQINPAGTVGFLGGWSETGRFFDPRNLEWLADYRSLDLYEGPRDVEHRSPTHVVFPPAGKDAWSPDFAKSSCITTAGDFFYELDISNLPDSVRNARQLAKHKLGLPHALKISATGKYIFCGAADYIKGQRARRVGIFEPETRAMEVVHLESTSWHIQTHPTKDVMYAVKEGYEEGEKNHHARWGNDISIPVEGNLLWEITPNKYSRGHGSRVRNYGMSMNQPANLTSDIVIFPNADGSVYVIYNACASSTLVVIRLSEDGKEQKHFPEFVEEGVWWFKGPHSIFNLGIPRLGLLRSYGRNIKEALWRVDHLFGNKLVRRAEFVTRNTLVDGSYGLMLSPDQKWLISSHRGGNWLLAYKFPEVLTEGHKALAYRIKLPPIRKHMPKNCPGTCGLLTDQRLGLHHSAMHIVSDSETKTA